MSGKAIFGDTVGDLARHQRCLCKMYEILGKSRSQSGSRWSGRQCSSYDNDEEESGNFSVDESCIFSGKSPSTCVTLENTIR